MFQVGFTSPAGTYSGNLPGAGPFKILFQDCGFPPGNRAAVYWNDRADARRPSALSVPAGGQAANINGLFGPDAVIQGTVTGPAHQPLQGVCVVAFDSNGQRVGHSGDPNGGSSAATTGATGQYTLRGLAKAAYRLHFDPECFELSGAIFRGSRGWADQWSGGKNDFASAVAVAAVPGSPAHVDATLGLIVPSAPTVKATAGANAATVTWTVPDPGRSPSLATGWSPRPEARLSTSVPRQRRPS